MASLKILFAIFFLLTGIVRAQSPFEGLTVEYYNGMNFDQFVSTKIDKRIGFSRRLKTPAPGVAKEFFSIRWTGSLVPPRSGLYTFNVMADDGVRLWINEELLVNAWVEQEATNYSATILLEKNQPCDLKIEYFNSIIHSVLQLQWELPPEEFSVSTNGFIPRLAKPSSIDGKYLTPSRTAKRPKSSLLVSNLNVESKPVAKDEFQPTDTEPVKIRVQREKQFKGEEPIVLRTVVFEQQSALIPADAYDELNELLSYLKKYPDKKIEIRGHTDYAGDSLDNYQLSEKRAKAIEAYLIKGGIETDRINSKGFGGSAPLITTRDIEDRLVNRRVEFIITD
jgi:outer membrane protein OmpA-like peptidoglycan-associated protein